MTDITENPGALKAMIEQLLDTIAYQQKRIEDLAQECLELEEAYIGALTVIDEMDDAASQKTH